MKLAQSEPDPIPQFQLPPQPVKVALVLGGGGSKGLAHVGVLHELEQAGIHPDLIVGCSSGAIIGALYADQPHVKRLESLLTNLKRSDILDFSLFSSPFGFVKGFLLKSFLMENLKARRFEQFQIPFIAVATDLSTGELIEFGGGEIIPAVHASAAVPGVFDPVKYLGRYLVDGGAADPIPADVAKKYGARVIIAVDVGEDLSSKEPYHLFHVAQRSLEISYRRLSEYVTRDADVVIRMNFQDLGMFSDRYNQEIYKHGRETAREMLPQIQRVILEKLPPEKKNLSPSWMLIE
ncbi:patatin-like phospholipase family protein [Candidatus Neptunichlamydia sp. REUL1]|uniref:patatin-like phospholipase family protein n=1 Tax=Candidatus Neptunichlamydia sp. REUL1 TaxID=3064277 RepID=UPI0029315E9B|nr:patatin-like phospholipase family protein [Candidatus Neptunochlamydia sp. REUL1]